MCQVCSGFLSLEVKGEVRKYIFGRTEKIDDIKDMATPRLRPVAARRRHLSSEIRGGQEKPQATLHQRPGAVTLRSHPEPEARGGSWEEPPEERWQRRPRRA